MIKIITDSSLYKFYLLYGILITFLHGVYDHMDGNEYDFRVPIFIIFLLINSYKYFFEKVITLGTVVVPFEDTKDEWVLIYFVLKTALYLLVLFF